MSVLSAPRPRTDRCVVEMMTQSYGLRTAVRRALNGADQDFTMLQSGGEAEPAGGLPDGTRKAVVIDADMPGLSGMRLLEQIAAAEPGTAILVVASDTVQGRSLRDRALAAGAKGAFLRPANADQPRDLKPLALEIVSALSKGTAKPPRSARQPSNAPPTATRKRPLVRPRPTVFVIGSSTGGPQALMTLFESLPPDNFNIPVLIVQHMPAAFTPILAEHLTRATAWTAKEGQHGEPLTPGEIRIAPGGQHMVVGGNAGAFVLELTDDPPVNFCKPSADVLFFSAAQQFGSGVLSLVLTGMGHDGAQGVKAISSSGGLVGAQDEETSVVWGMPGAAVATGVVDKVMPLADIGPAVQSAVVGGVAW